MRLKDTKSLGKIIVSLCLQIFVITTVMSQTDTIYYNAKWKTTVKDSAAFFRPPAKKEGELFKKEDFYISGALQMSGLSSSLDKDFWEGKVTWYNEDGSVLQRGTYKNNRLNGEYISTLEGKKIKAEFEKGRMVSGKTNGKFNNGRRYFTEMRGDTTVNIIYYKKLDGVRYERYSVDNRYDVLIKYFDVDGKFMGQRESLPNGEIKGLVVTYYKTPMRPMEIQYYANGNRLGTTFYYCKDQVREEFNTENVLSKTFYSPDGTILGSVEYAYENNLLQPVNGTVYTFYSSYNEYKAELIRSIKSYDEGKIVKDEQFYENQNLMSSTSYKAGAKELQISFSEDGEEIARMTYDSWNPMNGTEINGNRTTTYKDGKLVAEINTYFKTDLVFSKKTPNKETFYDKQGDVLGTLELSGTDGYPRPLNGKRYTIDFDGDIQAIELYTDSYMTERTSYRKRQVGENKSAVFKKVEAYEPNGFKRVKTTSFYSNENKQSEITFNGYIESTGVFYSKDGELLGEYDYESKEGTLYEFFGDSDELKRMEIRKDGKKIKLKRYDYGPNAEYGQINPVLVEDIDIDCCAMFYTREGKLLGKVIFKDGLPWEGKYYDIAKRTRHTIAQGKRNGLYEKLDYNQLLLEKGNFEDDKEQGLFSYYDYYGKLTKTENYKNGALDGIANYYAQDGDIQWEMFYKAGKPWNGTRVTAAVYKKKEQTETYQNGVLTKRVNFDDNGKRITNFVDGLESESMAYYGDTDVKRLSYAVKNNNLQGTVIRYDEQGKEQYRAVFDNGKLKEGTIMLTGRNIRGNPEYIILNRKPDILNVKLMGKSGKLLFTAEENLAFGVATVFMQSLDIYMDFIGPDRLY